MHGLPAPRLLYAGTLDSRIDVGQVLETARRFGRGSVVLMGPSREAAHLRPLRSVANVHIRPAAPREEVVRAIAAADACLIPHRRTPLTEAMSPLKLYEYLAAGRPVAAVDLPGVRAASSPRLVLTGNAGGFAEAVERALALGPAPEQERLAFVADNSWERRHDALLELALGPGQRYRHEVGRAA
jgi:glycosyltransferase involved in cell wall biosynthesis